MRYSLSYSVSRRIWLYILSNRLTCFASRNLKSESLTQYPG